MVSEAFENVIDAVTKLDLSEQSRLREWLDVWLAKPAAERTEDDIDKLLLLEGVLDHVPPPMTPEEIAAYKRHSPVEMIGGKPVSESLIEERR